MSKTAREHSPLLPIFLIVLVDVFGMTLVLPLLAIYAETFSASPLQATMLVSVYAACQLISGPMIGYASDRTGRKPMLLISQIGTFIGFIVLARATALWMIFLSRIIDGSTAGNLSLAQAYIADNTAPKDRGKAFGLIGIAFGLGFFVGPSLTGWLSAQYGLRVPIYLAAVMSLMSILCTAGLLTRGSQSTANAGHRWDSLKWRTYAIYFSRPVLRARLLQFLCFIVGFSTFFSGFALFAERRFSWAGHAFGPREIGFIFGYIGFLGIVLQGGLLGRLIKKFGEAALVTAGFVSFAIGQLILGATSSITLLLVAGGFAAFGTGVLRPALTSLISQEAGKTEQGVVLGITQSLMSIATVITPIVGGVLIEHHLLSLWAWLPAVAATGGLIFSRRSHKSAPKPEEVGVES